MADVTRMLKELNESQTALAGAGAGTGRAGGTSAGSDVDMDEKKGVLGTTDGGGGGGDKVWDYSPVELEKMEPISISPTLGNGSISEKKWRDPDKPQEKQ